MSLDAAVVALLLCLLVGVGLVGFVGLAAAQKGRASNKTLSIGGTALSAVAVVLAAVLLVVHLPAGDANEAKDEPASKGATPAPEDGAESPEPESGEQTPGSWEFPIGDGVTLEMTIRAETIEKPGSRMGREPTKAEYSLAWGPAVETNGPVAVVTTTVRTTSGKAVRMVASLNGLDPDLSRYKPVIRGTFDLTPFKLEAP